MKTIKNTAILFVTLLFLGACGDNITDDLEVTPNHPKADTTAVRYVTITANMPDDGPDTRVGVSQTDGLDLKLSWVSGEQVQMFIYQDGKVFPIGKHPVKNITNNGHSCTLTVPLPLEMDIEKPYKLAGFSGIEGTMTANGELSCSGQLKHFYTNTFSVPLFFSVQAGLEDFETTFQHLGCIEVLHITNESPGSMTYDHKGFLTSSKWWYDEFTAIPTRNSYSGSNTSSYEPSGEQQISKGRTATFYTWYVPNNRKLNNVRLVADINGAEMKSSNTKTTDVAIERGKAYHIRATWNGVRLYFGSEDIEGLDIMYTYNPLAYFAGHSFHWESKHFLNTWAIDPDGDGKPSSSYCYDYDSGDTHYRVPTIDEWRCMFPLEDEVITFDEEKTTIGHVETLKTRGEQGNFSADYYCNGTGQVYALRMKSNSSNHCYAFRYSLDEYPSTGKILVVTSRFVDNKNIGLAAVSNESYWSTPSSYDYTHRFPFHGYIYKYWSVDWHWTNYVYNLGGVGVYWAIWPDATWYDYVVKITTHTVALTSWNYHHTGVSQSNDAMLRYIIDD